MTITDQRWESLKSGTWFLAEQDEVVAYVERLRGALAVAESRLSTLASLVEAVGAVMKRRRAGESILREHMDAVERAFDALQNPAGEAIPCARIYCSAAVSKEGEFCPRHADELAALLVKPEPTIDDDPDKWERNPVPGKVVATYRKVEPPTDRDRRIVAAAEHVSAVRNDAHIGKLMAALDALGAAIDLPKDC